MRDENRIDVIMSEITRLWKLHPDYRLGQLLININSLAEKHLWFIEDDDWMYMINQYNKLGNIKKQTKTRRKKNE